MIVDAQSLIAFLKDIIEIYCSAKYEGVPYPKEMTSYIEQLQKDLAYEAGSKAQARDAEYFEKEIEKGEPIFSGINGRDKLEAARRCSRTRNCVPRSAQAMIRNQPWISSTWKRNRHSD